MTKIKQKQTIENAFFRNSGFLFSIAKDNYEKVGKDTKSALVCIVFSAITLETYINELLEMAKKRHSNTLLLTHSKEKLKLTNLSAVTTFNSNLESKYMMAKIILTGEAYKKEQNPYQSFNTLIQLRNAIVHLQLDDFTFKRDGIRGYPRILKKLPATALRHKGMNASWIRCIQTPEMARWAYNIAVDMIISITEALPNGNFKKECDFFVKNAFQKLP